METGNNTNPLPVKQKDESAQPLLSPNNEDGASSLDSSMKTVTIKSSVPPFVLYRYRWFILAIFTLQQIGIGQASSTFSAITAVVRDVYGVNDFAVSSLNLVFLIAQVPFNIPAGKLAERYGISVPLRIACVSVLLGLWIRLLANESFYFILAGQALMAFSYPFSVGMGPKVAAVWFGDDERAQATTVSAISHIFGILLGFAFPILFIKDEDRYNPEEAKPKIFKYILVHSIVVTVITIPLLIFIENRPPSPPSESARRVEGKMRDQVWPSIKKFITSGNAWLLSISYTCILSVYAVLGASVSLVSDYYGYTSFHNTVFGATAIICGLIGSMIHAKLLDKYKKFKLQLILIGITAAIGVSAALGLANLKNFPIAIIGMAMVGFFSVPVMGVAFSFIAEITYPMGEGISAGMIQTISGSLLPAFTYSFDWVLKEFGGNIALACLIGMIVIGTILAFFVKEELNKTKFQKEGLMETYDGLNKQDSATP